VSPNCNLVVSMMVHVCSKISKHCDTFLWFHLRHPTFGDSTNFQALVGTKVLNFEPKRTTICCNIGHVLDHSNRPQPAPGLDAPAGILASHLLPVTALDADVGVYQTSFTMMGQGWCTLSDNELGITFGFPLWLRMAHPSCTTFPLVPVQILDGCLCNILALSQQTQVLFTGTLGPKVGAPTQTRLLLYRSTFLMSGSTALWQPTRPSSTMMPICPIIYVTRGVFWCSHIWDQLCQSCRSISPTKLPMI
jgi:hypothetical protein